MPARVSRVRWVLLSLVVVGLSLSLWYTTTADYACRMFTRAFLSHDAGALADMLDYDFSPELTREGAVSLFTALAQYVPTDARAAVEEQAYGDTSGRLFLRSVRVVSREWPAGPTSAEALQKGGLLPLSLTKTERGWKVKGRAIPVLWLESVYGEDGRERGVTLWNSCVGATRHEP